KRRWRRSCAKWNAPSRSAERSSIRDRGPPPMKRLSIALLACLATSVAGAAGAPIVRGVGNGIYHSPPLNHDVQQTIAGTSLNFVTGDFDDTGPISGDWDTNFWDDDGFALYNIST